MMYDDELTKRDLYMYRRGEMREYIRNYMKEHGSLDPELRHRLYQWVDIGHDVHDNPWGIRDKTSHLPCDYLVAFDLHYSK